MEEKMQRTQNKYFDVLHNLKWQCIKPLMFALSDSQGTIYISQKIR